MTESWIVDLRLTLMAQTRKHNNQYLDLWLSQIEFKLYVKWLISKDTALTNMTHFTFGGWERVNKQKWKAGVMNAWSNFWLTCLIP